MKKIRLGERLFPSVVAWLTNRRIREEYDEKEWDSLWDYWKRTTNMQKMPFLENAANDLYDLEMQRKETVESKAASLFEAIGFAVSLISIAIVIFEKGTALVLFVFPLINFILAGISSWHATKIGEFSLLTLNGLKEELDLTKEKTGNNSKTHWMIEKLVNTEMNRPLILMKSNWLAAAYQHFLLGILSTILISAIMISEPYLGRIWEALNNVLCFP